MPNESYLKRWIIVIIWRKIRETCRKLIKDGHDHLEQEVVRRRWTNNETQRIYWTDKRTRDVRVNKNGEENVTKNANLFIAAPLKVHSSPPPPPPGGAAKVQQQRPRKKRVNCERQQIGFPLSHPDDDAAAFAYCAVCAIHHLPINKRRGRWRSTFLLWKLVRMSRNS